MRHLGARLRSLRDDVSEVSHRVGCSEDAEIGTLRRKIGREEEIEKKGERESRTSNIINVLINNDVHARIGIFVGCDVGDGEGFRHDLATSKS